jgi:acetamidase/formamidase
MTRRIKKKPVEALDPIVDSVLDPHTQPIAVVEPGETIVVETWSALTKVTNPVTGPIRVEGAEPGDTLVVELLDIELPGQGTVAILPGFGSLEGWLNLLEPKIKNCEIKGGEIFYETVS